MTSPTIRSMAQSRSLKSALAGALVAGSSPRSRVGCPGSGRRRRRGGHQDRGRQLLPGAGVRQLHAGARRAQLPRPELRWRFLFERHRPQLAPVPPGADRLSAFATQSEAANTGGASQASGEGAGVLELHAQAWRAQLPGPQLQRRWHQLQFEGRRPQLTAVPAGPKRLPGSVSVPGRRAGCALNKAVARRRRMQKIPRRRNEVQLHFLVRRHDKNLTKGSARALVATAPTPITQSSQVGHINGAKSAGRG